jgi:hypothetical protein
MVFTKDGKFIKTFGTAVPNERRLALMVDSAGGRTFSFPYLNSGRPYDPSPLIDLADKQMRDFLGGGQLRFDTCRAKFLRHLVAAKGRPNLGM